MFWKYSIEINLLEKINVETNKYKYLKSALDEITIKDVYLYNNKKQ